MPIPTRTQWQVLRDQNKVPRGAAKVSIGDSLDAVHKSFSLPTMTKHQQATVKLINDVDAYLIVVKKKYPAFEAIVTRQLKKKAEAHKRFVDDQVKAKAELFPRYKAAVDAYAELKAGNAVPKDVAKALERLLGCGAAFALVDPAKWDPRRQGLNRIMSEFERANVITAEHRNVLDKVLAEFKPK